MCERVEGKVGWGAGKYSSGMGNWILGNWWWLCARSSSPVFAQSLVVRSKVYALIDTCKGRGLEFNKFAFVFERPFSNNVGPVPVEWGAGCEIK